VVGPIAVVVAPIALVPIVSRAFVVIFVLIARVLARVAVGVVARVGIRVVIGSCKDCTDVLGGTYR